MNKNPFFSEKIDEDLTVSKDILGKINVKQHHSKANTFTMKPDFERNSVEKKVEKIKPTTEKPTIITTITTTKPATTIQTSTVKLAAKSEVNQSSETNLASFEKLQKNVQFVNSNDIILENKFDSTTQKNFDIQPSQATTYPKNFAYHRVTGKPNFLCFLTK